MKAQLMRYWDSLRSSFWFVPATISCVAVALVFSAVELDKAVADDWLARLGWRYSGGAEGASLLLGTFVPHLSASIGVLIYFIHHVSVSIQADGVVARVCRELEDGIDLPFLGLQSKSKSEIVRGAREAVPEANDRLVVEQRYVATTQALRRRPGSSRA